MTADRQAVEANVSSCRATLETRRQEAETALVRFFDAFAPVLQSWIRERVEDHVTKQYVETTMQLGEEKIR